MNWKLLWFLFELTHLRTAAHSNENTITDVRLIRSKCKCHQQIRTAAWYEFLITKLIIFCSLFCSTSSAALGNISNSYNNYAITNNSLIPRKIDGKKKLRRNSNIGLHSVACFTKVSRFHGDQQGKTTESNLLDCVSSTFPRWPPLLSRSNAPDFMAERVARWIWTWSKSEILIKVIIIINSN